MIQMINKPFRSIHTTPAAGRGPAGFTLIEMVIAIGIFTVIMSMSLGALFNVLNINRETRALKTVMNNLNYSVESMTRDIRFGEDYHCDSNGQGGQADILDWEDIPSPGIPGSDCGWIALRYQRADDEEPDWIGYFLGTDNSLKRKTDIDDEIETVTAPEVEIDSLLFTVRKGEDQHPFVIITIKGTAKVEGEEMEFNLQTSSSQRQMKSGL